MESTIFSVKDFKIGVSELANLLNIKNDTLVAELSDLAKEAEKIGAPRAVYRKVAVKITSDDTVMLDNATFKSRVLRVNLDGVKVAYPFVATCGPELDNWAKSFTEPAEKTFAAIIAGMGLGPVVKGLLDEVKTKFNIPHISYMDPGSIADWALTEQKPLFSLLGDVKSAIGVELLDSCFMKPDKSVSGIIFENHKGYENCMMCVKLECPGRRAPYDAEMFEREFKKK